MPLNDPSPAQPEEATHILGGQANLWAEYVATPSTLPT